MWFFALLWLMLPSAFVASEKPSAIYAQSGAVEASVTSVGGAAAISGNGRNDVRLVSGTTVAPGDEIDTRGGGRVVIDLTDGSRVVVLPNSRIVIGSFQNASSLKELLQITLGRIRVKINYFKGKPNPYRIKSPTASIAVRGTEFEVSVEALGETRIVVIDGSVEVSSLREPANPLIAEPGRSVIVRPNFTIDFLAADALTKEVGEREKQKQSNAANQKNNDDESSNSAANIYERSVESLIESGETALPSRFAAFPDVYLDSLDNPAYADSFRAAEGRFHLVPSINGSRSAKEDLRDRTTRATLGFGLGFVLRPRTIFSFDVAGGSIRTNQRRTEDLTANLLETERRRARFFSLHAAVQTDVRRNLFVSASILSLTNSRTEDTVFSPDRFGRISNTDGIFSTGGRAKDFTPTFIPISVRVIVSNRVLFFNIF